MPIKDSNFTLLKQNPDRKKANATKKHEIEQYTT